MWCFPVHERGDFSKNSGISQLMKTRTFCGIFSQLGELSLAGGIGPKTFGGLVVFMVDGINDD
jgi:hypothetical protein